MDFEDYFKDDSEEPTPWPGSCGDRSPQALESAAAMMTCMSLLRFTKPGKQNDEADLATDFGPVLAQFWLTLAQASAAWARNSPSDREGSRASLDQTHNWLANAVRQAPVDAHVLHTAGMILNDLVDLDIVEGDERAELLERACMSLREAARLAPGRFDILSDLGTVLGTQAHDSEGPESAALLREAAQRFAEAARCFDATHRRFGETGELHPSYVRALHVGGWPTRAPTRKRRESFCGEASGSSGWRWRAWLKSPRSGSFWAGPSSIWPGCRATARLAASTSTKRAATSQRQSRWIRS